MKKIVLIIAVLFSTTFQAEAAFATVSNVIPVGGVLTDKDGTPLNGLTEITFAIYDAKTGGTRVWKEDLEVDINNGVFSAYLGELEPLDLLDFVERDELWLGITVDDDSEAERILIASVPFAVEAQYCHQVVDTKCADAEYLQGWAHDAGTPICTPLSFTDLNNVPPDISDGDNDTQYTAGEGLVLSGTELAADRFTIEDWAEGVCYDSEAELTAGLDDDYVNEGQASSITDSMLAGGISPSKITGTAWTAANDGPLSGLNADLLDGQHGDAFAPAGHSHDAFYEVKYKRMVVVSPVGSGQNTVANGDALFAALEGINDASMLNPYLLKIEPGIYKIQESDGTHKALKMEPYVDIEGSGERVTKITGLGFANISGVVWGADNAELRFLTVESVGGPSLTYSTAVYNRYCAPSLLHITTLAYNSERTHGIYNYNASPTITSVRSNVWSNEYAYGIRDWTSSSTYNDVTISAYSSAGYAVGIRVYDATAPVHLDGINISTEAAEEFKSYGAWFEGCPLITFSNSFFKVRGGKYLRGIIFNSVASANVLNCHIDVDSTNEIVSLGIKTDNTSSNPCPTEGCVLKIQNSSISSQDETILIDGNRSGPGQFEEISEGLDELE